MIVKSHAAVCWTSEWIFRFNSFELCALFRCLAPFTINIAKIFSQSSTDCLSAAQLPPRNPLHSLSFFHSCQPHEQTLIPRGFFFSFLRLKLESRCSAAQSWIATDFMKFIVFNFSISFAFVHSETRLASWICINLMWTRFWRFWNFFFSCVTTLHIYVYEFVFTQIAFLYSLTSQTNITCMNSNQRKNQH